MSASAALKAVSHREALSKTVRLLTRDGIDVQFRGHQPHVLTKGNKAFRLVLPELNDTASPELLEAIQGYLDHEVGHIFYTPFARATKAGTMDKKAPALINIVEDIRLEKLLPIGNAKVQALPGTRENLERMYEKFIPTMIHPATSAMVATGNPSKMFAGVMVPALRALAGQKQFQAYMDANGYWPHFMPLLAKMPDLARRLKAMETFDDVEELVVDMIAALAPPPPPEPEEHTQEPPQEPQESDPDFGGDNDADDSDDAPDGADSDDGDDAGDDDAPSQDDGDGSDGDDDGDGDEGDTESDDGEGHGDGEGTDDGEGDDEDANCSGDGEDGEGDDDGDASNDAGKPNFDDHRDKGNGDRSDEESDDGAPGEDGNRHRSFTDAMKELDPAQRRALFMYKNRKQSVADIATEMNKSEDEVMDLLRSGRRRLGELMKGARK